MKAAAGRCDKAASMPSLHPAMYATVGKVRAGDDLLISFRGGVRLFDFQEKWAGVYDFAKVVRRNVWWQCRRGSLAQLTRRLGMREGGQRVSSRVWSKLGNEVGTVFFVEVRKNVFRILQGALRCTAWRRGGSPSTEPKLPGRSISGYALLKVLRDGGRGAG